MAAHSVTDGMAIGLLFQIPDSGLLIYLGFFAGFLLYIGASGILPEAHAAHPSLPTIGFTIAGTGLMYLTITLLR